MKRDDIIKALECCYSNRACDGCPNSALVDCRRVLEQNTISLIKELTEENESRKQIIDQLGKNNDEIARVYPLVIKEAKANTVRKMQERLKAKAYTNNYCQDVVLLSNIDQIVKEMLEGEDDNKRR